ncbi:MAG: SUMF1/EgtB/PvdO family nonheme iron enzyme [Deltaproteobacteria bacterium]|jgi:formylglycine-generating enzyme required for sulfatase activity|nr:SUMF1/EgtB/PvdO family nonheme iron enzyme [Deltaproteobacteria bacterium]MBW2530659.1 SUMF1/EgtB/PvdO family nonheme iron enzyme [Deltaproteobacteria bacterium]
MSWVAASRLGRRALVVAALPALPSCEQTAEPLPQWRVTVATDAPALIGDRLLIELLDPDTWQPACPGCRRQFGAAEGATWPLSFGVTPPSSPWRVLVRVRLYRSDYVGLDGLPAGEALVDASGWLPADPSDVSITLWSECFGVAGELGVTTCHDEPGSLSPIDDLPPAPSAEALPAAGSWPQAERTPCSGAVPDGMVCVPGGVFLLGNPSAPEPVVRSAPERLVRISPFALDRDEVTVGQVRELVKAGAVVGEPVTGIGDDPEVECTYRGIDDSSKDGLPINCASAAFAESVCAALGKRLPTEAEWEYAATGAGAESAYPWGASRDSEDLCARAVIARGRRFTSGEATLCRALDDVLLPGLVAGGSDRDVTALEIRNLAGNVSEWVADDFAPYSDSCWGPTSGFSVDPQCILSTPGGERSVRGGSWYLAPVFARSEVRAYQFADEAIISLGFRCAL